MIRDATEDDVPALVALGQRFRAEVYADRLPARPDCMAALGRQLLTSDDGHLWMAEHEGHAVGMLGALIFQHPLSGERTAAELFWYVAPDRRGALGVRLLATATAWAKARGATRLQIAAPTPDLDGLYTRLGFGRVETMYDKAL